MKRIVVFTRSLFSHHLAKDGLVMFTGTMVANVCAYLYHLVVGRILGKEAYGEVGALLSLIYILNVPALVLQMVLVKFFSIYKATNSYDKVRSLFVMATTYTAVIAALFFFISLPLAPLITGYLHLSSPWLVVWLLVGFIFFVLTTVNSGVLQGLQQFRTIAILSIIASVLRLVFGAAGSFFGVGWTIAASSAAGILTYALFFVPLGFVLRQKKSAISVDIKPALRYMLPTFLAILGITAVFSQDVLLVKHYLSAADAGLYAAVSILGKIIYYASFTIGIIIFPVLAERKERDKSYQRMVRLGLVVVGAISASLALAYALIPTLIIRLLYGSAYEGAGVYLFLFGLFMMFFSLSYFLIQVCLAIGKTGVWKIALTSAVLQGLSIVSLHGSILSIMYINIAVSAALFVALLLYYRHAK